MVALGQREALRGLADRPRRPVLAPQGSHGEERGMADTETAASGGMKKELTLFNFFTIGFGAIIGTGWVLLVGDSGWCWAEAPFRP